MKKSFWMLFLLAVVWVIWVMLFLWKPNERIQGSTSDLTPEIWEISKNEAFLGLLTNEFWTESYVNRLTNDWESGDNIKSVEILNFLAWSFEAAKLVEEIKADTWEDFGFDAQEWYSWIWNQPENISADYANFKADLYKNIDPRFDKYFRDRWDTAQIRLDEIRWGWVVQDGIPPLRQPEMILGADADYLDDDDVVFGIEVEGDVRAYPKRILAWHEMFVDTVGWIPVAWVYCTLCWTVILYETEIDGKNYEIGTSWFLYRSNKLMYDRETQSLWNTIKGEPVLGPLVGQWIALKHRSVVTTTWWEWKKRHPETQVLSLNTGHNRDYGEGIAYNEYFATDTLMFHTPFNDTRLKNKQEVLALRFPAHPSEQLAIDTDFLLENPIYYDKVWEQEFVVVTDVTWGNRVYEWGVQFESYDRETTLIDANGEEWILTENQLTSASGERLGSLPYHRSFWFGWHATYPESRLIK